MGLGSISYITAVGFSSGCFMYATLAFLILVSVTWSITGEPLGTQSRCGYAISVFGISTNCQADFLKGFFDMLLLALVWGACFPASIILLIGGIISWLFASFIVKK